MMTKYFSSLSSRNLRSKYPGPSRQDQTRGNQVYRHNAGAKQKQQCSRFWITLPLSGMTVALILCFSFNIFAQNNLDLSQTEIFCYELKDHFENKKVLDSQDLINFIKIIDLEKQITNRVPEARSRINFKNGFAFKKFEDLLERDLDLDKLRACANNLLDKSERVKEKRETEIFW